MKQIKNKIILVLCMMCVIFCFSGCSKTGVCAICSEETKVYKVKYTVGHDTDKFYMCNDCFKYCKNAAKEHNKNYPSEEKWKVKK